uniref:Si:ch211-98n17.5 n=1 Tax=Astyanax mexicanus TaxID=7994 RepID=W5KFQ4_ASTMX
MKLPLGLSFALLLMLSNLRQVSTQESQEWSFDPPISSSDGETMGENASGLNGEEESFLFSNQTSEDPTNEEPENEQDSTTLTPPPHVIPLNSSNDFPQLTNNETTSNSGSTTASPELTTKMSNYTGLNSTVSSSGSFPSNVTVIDTFYTQNSTTSYQGNSTTAYPPYTGNTTTVASTSTAIPANATTVQANATTIPANATTIQANATTVQTNATTIPANATTIPANATTTPANTTKLPSTRGRESTRPNRTGVSFDMRGNSERGVSPDFKQNAKSQAWGAIVGIGVAVGFVALVVYVIMKRRSHRDFSHRKLVEDMPPDPVLRLDNSEPLDLKYDGSGYYNPGVQGDNIQMTNFPRGHSN